MGGTSPPEDRNKVTDVIWVVGSEEEELPEKRQGVVSFVTEEVNVYIHVYIIY